MEIRQAQESDIPAIVSLLKLSLGESLMPKSEAFWRWKHLDNPFGKSPVLLAFEGDLLVGIRAFMRWEWQHGEKTYKAVRAVDTATHPEFQGKGIFRKLTLQLVDICKQEGIDFIFNTPNKDSKPGYLKMGWNQVGKLRIGIRPVFNWKESAAGESEFLWDDRLLLEVWKKGPFQDNKVSTTSRSVPFLQWRYRDNPNIKYYMAGSVSQSFLVIFRIKKSRGLAECRVCEMIGSGYDLSKALLNVARVSGSNVITFSGNSPSISSVRLAIGPDVTLLKLNGSIPVTFDTWRPTLGDMEVF